MTLEQIRVFVAVVEHGSIRGAARELGLAQSGLTQQIKRLEVSLGVELFTRGRMGIVLTGAGDSFLARSRLILRECGYALTEARSHNTDILGKLSVGASAEAFSECLLPVIDQFRARYKRVSLHIASGPANTLLTRVREGRLDFAVTLLSSSADITDLAHVRLQGAQPAILCRQGHPLGQATSIHDLAGAEWVSTSWLARQGAPSNRLYDLFNYHGCGTPNVILTVESLFDTLSLLCNSDMLFLGPSFVLGTAAFNRHLSYIPISEGIPAMDLCLIHLAQVPLQAPARELASMAISYSKLPRATQAIR